MPIRAYELRVTVVNLVLAPGRSEAWGADPHGPPLESDDQTSTGKIPDRSWRPWLAPLVMAIPEFWGPEPERLIRWVEPKPEP